MKNRLARRRKLAAAVAVLLAFHGTDVIAQSESGSPAAVSPPAPAKASPSAIEITVRIVEDKTPPSLNATAVKVVLDGSDEMAMDAKGRVRMPFRPAAAHKLTLFFGDGQCPITFGDADVVKGKIAVQLRSAEQSWACRIGG